MNIVNSEFNLYLILSLQLQALPITSPQLVVSVWNKEASSCKKNCPVSKESSLRLDLFPIYILFYIAPSMISWPDSQSLWIYPSS